MKYLFVTFLSALMMTACSSAAQHDLDAAAFERGIADTQAQLLDVRTLAEYNSGHISNALLADWTERKDFDRRIQSLNKQAAVYTYCLSGGRSGEAAAYLRKNGFRKVYNLDGGILAWKAARKPVASPPAAEELTPEQYQSQIPADGTVLVDFGASWCPPCRQMKPVIDALVSTQEKPFRFLPIDGGAQARLMESLNITVLPTFIIYKNGKETWRGTGVIAKETLLRQL